MAQGERVRNPPYASYRGPGPAGYQLPAAFGNKQHDKTRKAAPAFSMKPRREEKLIDHSPGPVHQVPSDFSPEKRKGKGMRIRSRPKPLPDKEVRPSPCDYDPDEVDKRFKRRAQPTYSIAKAKPKDLMTDAPPATRYSLPPINKTSQRGVRDPTAFSFKGYRGIKGSHQEDLAATPGPAAHGKLADHSGPRYSFKGRPKDPKPKMVTPAPGAYTPKSPTKKKSGASFGVKYSDYVYTPPW
eukprot:m.187096 g.187096  ORF g.187096 m.187096 type:complete len:241 (-) comp18151_c0_seq4:10-732(-)